MRTSKQLAVGSLLTGAAVLLFVTFVVSYGLIMEYGPTSGSALDGAIEGFKWGAGCGLAAAGLGIAAALRGRRCADRARRPAKVTTGAAVPRRPRADYLRGKWHDDLVGLTSVS